MSYIVDILSNFWMVLGMMAPYLLLGFLMAGLLSALISPQLVERHLGGRGLWPVVKAALLGMPIPLCSCAVIPVSASLRRHGASKGSTISFLISTPETGVDGIAATWGVMGGVYAAFRVVVALVSGVIGGLAVELFDRKDSAAAKSGGNSSASASACTDSCCIAAPGQAHGKVRRILEYGFLDLPRDIGKSLLAGLIIAALIKTFVPAHYLHGTLLGHGILAMLAAALLAGPVYVCATASVPMAAAMIGMGFSPGAALVFLMVGPATNAATIAMVWKVMGSRTAAIYLLSVLGCAIAAGLTMDYIYQALALTLPAMLGHNDHENVGVLQSIAAAALLAIIGHAIWRRGRAKSATHEEFPMQSQTLHVTGMTCSHCAATVRRALLETPGVQSAEVDLAAGTAMVSGKDLDAARLKAAVMVLGYGVKE